MDGTMRAASFRAFLRRLGLLAAVVTAGLVLPPASAQAQPSLEIQVIPESVKLLSSGPVPAQVVVRNSGPLPLGKVTLTWFKSGGVQVIAPSTSIMRLGPGDSRVFPVTLTQTARGALPGQVTFRVAYRETDPSGSRTRSFGSASLSVEPAEVETASEVAGVEVRTSLASLAENRPGRLYLLLSNKTNVNIRAFKVAARRPKFIKLIMAQELPISIPPGELRVIRFDVIAGPRLTPGKQILVFGAWFKWTRGHRNLTGNVVASHEVSVEVFGESALLGVVAVPALLLLPGALILLTLLGAATRVRTGKWDPLPLDPLRPFFWVIAVPLSFLMAAVYPVFPWGQNYLLAYGFRDIVLIWISSSLIGVVAFLLWLLMLVPSLRRSTRHRQGTEGMPASRTLIEGGRQESHASPPATQLPARPRYASRSSPGLIRGALPGVLAAVGIAAALAWLRRKRLIRQEAVREESQPMLVSDGPRR
jgi:hypothetical protein